MWESIRKIALDWNFQENRTFRFVFVFHIYCDGKRINVKSISHFTWLYLYFTWKENHNGLLRELQSTALRSRNIVYLYWYFCFFATSYVWMVKHKFVLASSTILIIVYRLDSRQFPSKKQTKKGNSNWVCILASSALLLVVKMEWQTWK